MPALRTLLVNVSYHLAMTDIGTRLSGARPPPPMKPDT